MEPIEKAKWQKVARELGTRLGTDYRNHQMLSDPWSRAAHSMVQGWRNIHSQGRLGYVPATQRRPTTWKDAAQTMKASLDARRRSRLLDQTTWQFWANHLPRVELRYIPKAARHDRVREAL